MSAPALLLSLSLLATSAQDHRTPLASGARQIALDLCASPRLAGTAGSLTGARTAARYLEEAGWEVELDAREVLLTYPRRQAFSIYPGPTADAEAGEAPAPLVHRVSRFDPVALPPGDVPLYNAWSASGSVRAPVVDVGHGLREDYADLAAAGVDVRGAIALARYGRSYRGIKVELAEEHGCVGLLLFSEGDGAERGEVWPFGPWKPGHEAQRGSISPMARAPGDPTTPGWGSPAPEASLSGRRRQGTPQRLDAATTAQHLPRIPCLPLGYDDAAVLLAGLGAGGGGRGSAGPGPAEALLEIDQPRELRTIYNVIARLPGAGPGLVIAGSHRDAWVRGGHDSGTGAVMLIRAAQHLGERARAGWRPAHSLIIGLWDAEEFGLIGSTEWAEAHADQLRANGLAYINADAAISGLRFGASGTPGMLAALRPVLERLPDPTEQPDPTMEAGSLWSPGSLWSQWSADSAPRLGLPGSGSDFAVFLHHLSIPVLDVGFRGGSGGGQYHTAFDDFPLVDRYIDPGFVAHEFAGRFAAELLAELADAPDAGFSHAEAARELARVVRATATPGGDQSPPWLAPEDVEELARAFDDLAGAAARPVPGVRFYAALELPDGLPERPWFKNRLWAPGLETGYRAETLPTLRRAARQGPADLQAELSALSAAIAALEARLLEAPEPASTHARDAR